MENTEPKFRSSKWIFMTLGLVAVFISNLTFFILGENSVIDVHDQLDGEIVAYILGSRYLFSGVDFYPEFLGGVSSAALTPPSYGTLLFYRFLSPLHAFLVNQAFVTFTAFLGMYLWLSKLTKKNFISFCSALLFSFLPFFSVYGISVSGIPMVALAVWEFVYGQESHQKRNFIIGYILISVYALFSSFVLCGYAVCAVYFVSAIILSVYFRQNAQKTAGIKGMWIGLILLVLIYLILNRNLILQVIHPEMAFVSHKSEAVLSSGSFWGNFCNLFFRGSDAVPSLHSFILAGAIIALAVFFVRKKHEWYYRALSILMITVLVISAFYGFMHTAAVVDILNGSDSALKTFQIDRFYWFNPFLWYTILGLTGVMITEYVKKPVVGTVIFLIILAPTAITVLKQSPFKENAMEFVRKESTAFPWKAYFCEDEYQEISDYISDNYSLEKGSFRVASLGLEPAVALYNGFYTIDGYSNNYDLEYKHKFRKIIAKELDKSEYNRAYFDNWGNRCYILSSEYPGARLMTKSDHSHYEDLELNSDALKDLDCRFVFSSGPIEGPEKSGLKFCKVFDSYEYSYFIYLYEVE
ncbi:MAG: DUF6044 family protein [Acetatifactor sp.]|nr:DUF6044 family protein [Acetatifactor sp.]